MIKVNSIIKVKKSVSLSELKLDVLAGQKGSVVQDLSNKERKNKGYMVKFDTPYLNELIWFIPLESVKELGIK